MHDERSPLVFLPVPKKLVLSGAPAVFRNGARIVMEGAGAEWAGVRAAVEGALAEAGIAAAGADSALPVRIVRMELAVPQAAEAYRLTVDADGVLLKAAADAGAFYGAMTLRQLARQAPEPGVLPGVRIEDRPDFPHRGFMLDVSRCKVPSTPSLFALVDLLAELKLNQLQLYTEHTFAYRGHRRVWEHASPLTAEEIRALDAYCRERHVELVPNQNSFGHMERWLCHAEYAHLSEAPDGFMTPWGEWRATSSTLWAAHPGSLELVRGLYAELLPNFASRLFNVGCDETFDLGQGRSREECERRGKGRVYLEFLLKIHRLVRENGRTMQFWGDIILHYPELIPELPRDVVPLVWGYEADHPFAEQCKAFADNGFRFYVCPGTSTWQALGGRTANALANLRSAAANGLAHGAEGYLITDWGDFGHWQPWATALLPLAYGAGLAWSVGRGCHYPGLRCAAGEGMSGQGDATAAQHAHGDGSSSAGSSNAAERGLAGVGCAGAARPGNGTPSLPAAGRDARPPVLAVLDRLLFRDRAGKLARAAHDLGDVYRETGVLLHNASALSRILLLPADKPLPKVDAWAKLTAAGLDAAEAAVARAEALLAEARPECADAALLPAEFRQMAAMMRLACRAGRARLASPDGCLCSADAATRRALAAELEPLIAEQRRLWLARNREGGLAESLRPLELCLDALRR